MSKKGPQELPIHNIYLLFRKKAREKQCLHKQYPYSGKKHFKILKFKILFFQVPNFNLLHYLEIVKVTQKLALSQESEELFQNR